MTIGLTYNDDLSRVQIALSGLSDGTVEVQRSTNQLFWTTVRGGVELPVVSGLASLDDFEFTPDVPNFYRLLAIDPEAGLILPGASGDTASTPDAAVLDITGDIDIRAELVLSDWTTGTVRTIISKYHSGTNNRSWIFRFSSGDLLQFVWSTNGTSDLSNVSTAAPEPDEDGRLAVRVTIDVNDGGGNRVTTYYTAPTIDGPWEQLGDAVTTSGTTSIFSGAADLIVGARNASTTELLTGTVVAAQVYNGIAGTAVANPNFAEQDSGDTSFVDNAGRTWTVNGNADILGEVVEVNSITPDLDGEIWLKNPKYPFLNRPVQCVVSGDVERQSRTGVFGIKGRSMPVAVTDLRGSQQFTLSITTQTLEDARDLDLILATGEVMLIHVPMEDTSGCGRLKLVPGGYVAIGDTVQRRAVPGSRIYSFTLPCITVNPPGPDVVPTNLTWGTVFNLYGDWNALIAANPTWADLLETVGDPEDLVVL